MMHFVHIATCRTLAKGVFSHAVVLALIVSLLPVSLAEGQARVHREKAGQLRRLPDAAVPINLYELLGPDAYARGVIWQPMTCYAPTSQNMINNTDENLDKLDAMILQDLMEALSDVVNVSVATLSRESSFPLVSGEVENLDQNRLDTDQTYRKFVLRTLSASDRYWRWLRRLSLVALKYTANHRDPGTQTVAMACLNSTIADLIGRVVSMPAVDCNNETSIIDAMGLFNDPNLRLGTITQRVIRDPGWCSVRPQYIPYGQWLKKERIMRRQPGDQRYRFDNRHKDRVVFLFDLLYEAEMAFKRQHWLGAVVQQNPFDMYAIMDLIHILEADLVIETGTANGGSALLWASMLELTRPGRGKVITIDVNEPVTDSWAGVSVKDPTKDPLWAKYVTFLKGSSLDEKILTTVRQAVASAKVVLVLLDSDHTEHHVELEAEAYCPLVTNGSYCIVQDTKLSRFSTIGGPTPGIRRFLRKRIDFVVDRDREPFYTQHVGGYLLRVGVDNGARAGVQAAAAAAAATATTGGSMGMQSGGRRRLLAGGGRGGREGSGAGQARRRLRRDSRRLGSGQ